MQCAVFTFRIRTGTGTQTVSGIVDKDGAAFVPEYLFFVNASSETNVLWSNGTGLFNTSTFNSNIYRVSDGAAGYRATGELPQFGGKIGSGAGGTGPSAALDSLEADAFFGGNVYRTCRINSVSSGQFELEVLTTTSWAFDTDVMCMALANDGDLLITASPAGLGSDGAHMLGYEPKAVLQWADTEILTTGSIATSAGGEAIGWGFDTPNGGAFTSMMHIVNQGANYRYQRQGTWLASIDDSGVASGGAYTSAWSATGLTTAHVAPNTAASGHSNIVSGSSVVAASGSFAQLATTGAQTISTGILPAFILFATTGIPASTAVDSAWAELSSGWTNGVTQQCLWAGESRVGNVQPLYGGNYLSDANVIRVVDAAGPNGASTVFGATAEIVSINSDGSFTINWLTNDGVARDIFWFALGEALPASLTVRKIVTAPPSHAGQTFDFTIGGGLLPDTLTLGDGDSYTYTDIVPGTYSVLETPILEWLTTYSVSNGDNPSAITIGAGDTVEVIVRNQWPSVMPNLPIWKLYRFDIRPRREARA